MAEKELAAEPAEVYNLKGDTERIDFLNRFKEVKRLKTQLDQYTDLTEEQEEEIEQEQQKGQYKCTPQLRHTG